MGILGNLDTDFFAPKAVAQPKVQLDDSLVMCLVLWARKTIAQEKTEIANNTILQRRDTLRSDLYQGLINKSQGRIDVLSGWINKTTCDQRLTRILSIPGLTRVWGEEHPKVPFRIGVHPYAMALTEDIILTDDRRGFRWNLGPFILMLPLGGQVGEIHWVPKRNPTAVARHPHHGLWERHRDGEARTCLGSFHEYVETGLQMGDIVSLLHLMSDYIRSYDPGSVLFLMHEISHAQRA